MDGNFDDDERLVSNIDDVESPFGNVGDGESPVSACPYILSIDTQRRDVNHHSVYQWKN